MAKYVAYGYYTYLFFLNYAAARVSASSTVDEKNEIYDVLIIVRVLNDFSAFLFASNLQVACVIVAVGVSVSVAYRKKTPLLILIE